MAFNVSEIRSQLTGGGARPTLFQVRLTNPVNASGDLKTSFMAKATQLPASTLGTIEVPYFGRKIKVPGDRTFAEWTITVINDEDFLIRNSLEQWSNSINLHEQNLNILGTAPSDVQSQGQVVQYGKDGKILRVYNFNNVWPSEVSPIDLSWDSTDQIEEYTVTLQYDWWNISTSITGFAGGQ